MIRIILFVFALLTSMASAGAGPFEDARAAHARYEYKKADALCAGVCLEKWLPLAQRGDAKAQSNVGEIYWSGLGVRSDMVEAVKWHSLAAVQGDAVAQYRMGWAYAEGFGNVKRDDAKAVKRWHEAAGQGHATAQFTLGNSYSNGQNGLKKNETTGLMWYLRAAEQGNVNRVQGTVSLYYEHGMGALQDYVQAHKWYNLSSASGDKVGREYMDRLAKKMTPAQVAEAQRLAREWKPK